MIVEIAYLKGVVEKHAGELERAGSARELVMSRARNSAKSVFAGQKDVFVEFETIRRARNFKP